MVRLITALFFLLLIALALTPLYADPPFAPFAVCKDGKCVMSESDYKTYRAWHFALIDRMRELNDQNAELQGAVDRLQGVIARNAYCEGHKS